MGSLSDIHYLNLRDGGLKGEVAVVGGRPSAVLIGLYRYSFDPFLFFPAKL